MSYYEKYSDTNWKGFPLGIIFFAKSFISIISFLLNFFFIKKHHEKQTV